MAVLQVGADGKAPSDAKIGDTIKTAGGDYKIMGGSAGKWLSEKVSETVSAPVGTSRSGGSSRTGYSAPATSTWQDAMAKTYSGGPAAIQAEIDRAAKVLASGNSTEATSRYWSQMNALMAGKSLQEVVSGKWDLFTPNGKGGGYDPSYPDPGVNAYDAIGGDVPPKYTDPSSYHVDYSTGVVNGGGGQAFGTNSDALGDISNRINNAVSSAIDDITPDWFKYVQENGVVIIGGLLSTVLLLKVFGK